MRLLNVKTKQFTEFVKGGKIPPYAILSHTWSEDATDEVTLQDWGCQNVDLKPGYQKILDCCSRAEADGLKWVWVDTCCIDKKSTAELSEAINSMFRWYRDAKVCYAYLADVDIDQPNHQSIFNSRWFSRGWTLQELLAPRSLIFFSKNWRFLGTKGDMAKSGFLLSRATRIDKKYLLMKSPMLHETSESPNIAQIMSWAATRETTRIEDKAYCLLGLFDINMPLLYGEGTRAFFRLQEELLKCYDDHTLFAWGPEFENPPLPKADLDMHYDPSTNDGIGMLARDPSVFLNSGNIRQKSLPHKASDPSELGEWGNYLYPASIVHRGIRIELPCEGWNP